MRTRIVVWGTNAQDQKVLIGISLLADENKIELVAIPARDCSEDFYNQMMNQWREGADLVFPESTEKRTLELTMSESILPEDFRVERSDMIQRAQMEWHFLVLSTKLYRNFKTELEDMADKVKRLEVYDKNLWDELKSLWETIQKHTFDRNILRDHADSLREKSNSIFEELKKLRSSVEQELVSKSSALVAAFQAKLDDINNRIQSGGVLKLIFDDLKKIQEEFKTQSLTKEDRNSFFKKLDEAFNAIREKRNSGSSKPSNAGENNGGAMNRVNARMQGLEQAIKKIEKSIEYDLKDIEFENKRIATSTGQLEAQIRVAKIKMIEDRIKSKKEKLDELNKVKTGLLKSTEVLKKKEEKRIKKNEEKEHRKEVEEKVKARYEVEIQQKQNVEPEMEDKLIKAAEEIKLSKRSRKKSSADNPLESSSAELSNENEIDTSNNNIVQNSTSDSNEEISESDAQAIDELIETALEDTKTDGSVSDSNNITPNESKTDTEENS